MIHYMKLYRDPFAKIADGGKTIELRLNDEKRQGISVGDVIAFSCTENKNIAVATVRALHEFPDFEALYKALPLSKCGYTETELDTAHYTDMEQYYTKEQIAKYGALGIELSDIYSICDVKEKITDKDILPLLAPSVYNPTPERLQSRADKYSEDESVCIYAYKDSGEYKGIVVFKIEDSIATILDIAVAPQYQGNGIGGKLMDYIKDKIQAQKITAETDDDAVAFYKKHGFNIVKIKTVHDTNRYQCIFEE